LFFEKRDFFSLEKEVRILTELRYKDSDELAALPKGYKINIDPHLLIDEIKLTPLADENFKKLITSVLDIERILVPVNYSVI
jgi:hypothetical protein